MLFTTIKLYDWVIVKTPIFMDAHFIRFTCCGSKISILESPWFELRWSDDLMEFIRQLKALLLHTAAPC